MLLAIPGAMPWLMIGLAKVGVVGLTSGSVDLAPVVFVLMVLAVTAAIAALTVKGPWHLKLVVALFNLSYFLILVVPYIE